MKKHWSLRLIRILCTFSAYVSLMAGIFATYTTFNPAKFPTEGQRYSLEASHSIDQLNTVMASRTAALVDAAKAAIHVIFFLVFLQFAKLIRGFQNSTFRELSTVARLRSLSWLLVGGYGLQLLHGVLTFQMFRGLSYFDLINAFGSLSQGNRDELLATLVSLGINLGSFLVPYPQGVALLCIAAAFFFWATVLDERIRLENEVQILKLESVLTV